MRIHSDWYGKSCILIRPLCAKHGPYPTKGSTNIPYSCISKRIRGGMDNNRDCHTWNNMSEAENMCSRLAITSNGGSPEKYHLIADHQSGPSENCLTAVQDLPYRDPFIHVLILWLLPVWMLRVCYDNRLQQGRSTWNTRDWEESVFSTLWEWEDYLGRRT